jgi:structural maintenance of chromosome 1
VQGDAHVVERDCAHQNKIFPITQETLVTNHMVWRLFHIESEISTCQGNIEKADETLEEAKAVLNDEEAKVKEAKKQQAKANLAVKKQEAVVKAAEKEIEDKRPGVLTLETQIDHSKRKVASTEKLVTSVEKDEARQATTVNNLNRDLRDAEQAAEAAAERQRIATEARGAAFSAADLEEYRGLRANANAQASDERKELDAKKRQGRGLRDTLTTAQETLARYEGKKAKLSEQVASLQERVDVAQSNVDDLQNQVNGKKAESETLASETRRISQLETEVNEKLHDTLQQLLQFRATKSESDRALRLKDNIAKLKKVFSGVHGRVYDLCKPSERRYNTAVKIVLGRNTDSIVVDHEDTAIRCIEYLRQNRSGQATFIPLDTIQVKPVQERLRGLRGARVAIDIIQYDPVVERAMQHACGSALVCDTMEIARDICYSKGIEVKAVTLDGTILHKSGLITGGGVDQNEDQQWDQRKVQDLEKARDAQYQQLSNLVKNKPNKDTIDQLSRDLNAVETALRIAKEDLTAASTRLQGAKGELKQTDRDVKKQQSEVTKAERAVQQHERQMQNLANTVNEADDAVFEEFCGRLGLTNVREYENVQLRAAEEETEARARFDAQIARLTHQIKFETEQLENTRERLNRLRATITRENDNVSDKLETALSDIRAEIEQAEEELSTLRETLDERREELARRNEEADAARKAQSKALKRVDDLQKDIGEWVCSEK